MLTSRSRSGRSGTYPTLPGIQNLTGGSHESLVLNGPRHQPSQFIVQPPCILLTEGSVVPEQHENSVVLSHLVQQRIGRLTRLESVESSVLRYRAVHQGQRNLPEVHRPVFE